VAVVVADSAVAALFQDSLVLVLVLVQVVTAVLEAHTEAQAYLAAAAVGTVLVEELAVLVRLLTTDPLVEELAEMVK
jgi:hypothetical protein